MKNAVFAGSILPDTDLRKTDLRDALFDGAILNGTMLDGARLEGADFSGAEIESLFVFDEFESRTRALLQGRHGRQWLYSQGAQVQHPEELNQLLGKPWYEAAREVTRTLQQRIAGSHQDSSLAKGTNLKYRPFAKEFVKHLRTCGVLEPIKRGRSGTVIRVVAEHRDAVKRFNEEGAIDPLFQSFFEKYT